MEMDQNFTLLAHSRVESPRNSGGAFRRIELAIGRRGSLYRAIVRESWGLYQAGSSEIEEGFLRVTSTDSDWPLALLGVRDKASPRKIGADPEAAQYLKAALAECEASLRTLKA
ncbi:MAG: hypothetical protein PHT19_05045 [Methylococcus sp.]|nr:hypothetical protein [Methylococcus sp.]